MTYRFTEFGVETDVLIRVQSQNIGESEALSEADKAAVVLVKETIGADYTIRRTEYVGAVVGGELRNKQLGRLLQLLARS